MTQKPVIEQLLPLYLQKTEERSRAIGIIFMNPMRKELLDILLTRYIESQVYQG